MATKIFIGGLNWNTTESELRDAFEKFGAVSEAKIITDRDTGRSRGFGFVTFNDGESSQGAIDEMNGTEFAGRTITVNEARERSPRRDS
jgi:RNA recognition motif-containing protein